MTISTSGFIITEICTNTHQCVTALETKPETEKHYEFNFRELIQYGYANLLYIP
jgi:hypothetical protein